MKTSRRALWLAAGLALVTGSCHSKSGPRADASTYGAGAVGVHECDDYLTTYERCVGKAPVERRDVMRENLERDRRAWRALAADPGAKPGLAQSCRLARKAARGATSAYGCAW